MRNWSFNNGCPIKELFAEPWENCYWITLRFDIALKTLRRYVDDSHARFGSRSNATELSNVFISQDPQMQYTIEYEN